MMLKDELEVHKETIGDVGVVCADGIVDLATMRPLREAVRALIDDGVNHIVLDLCQVGYMDSAGISTIMTAKRGVADRNGQVFVVTQPGEVQRALLLIQMDRVVRMVDCRQTALDEIAAPGA